MRDFPGYSSTPRHAALTTNRSWKSWCSRKTDIIAIAETWWEDPHNWSAAKKGKKLFRRARVFGSPSEGWEHLDHLEHNDGDVRVECL